MTSASNAGARESSGSLGRNTKASPSSNRALKSKQQQKMQAKAQHPTFTPDGYEICNAFPGRVLPDSKRYINPKMENELKIFKKKITARFANREIAADFTFPRVNIAKQIVQEEETQRIAQLVATNQHQHLLHQQQKSRTSMASTTTHGTMKNHELHAKTNSTSTNSNAAPQK